jgi:predicted small secreted protein
MKSLKLTAIAVGIALCASSCNTFIGIGRDMRLAGEGMEKTANKASGGGGDAEADTSGAPVY